MWNAFAYLTWILYLGPIIFKGFLGLVRFLARTTVGLARSRAGQVYVAVNLLLLGVSLFD